MNSELLLKNLKLLKYSRESCHGICDNLKIKYIQNTPQWYEEWYETSVWLKGSFKEFGLDPIFPVESKFSDLRYSSMSCTYSNQENKWDTGGVYANFRHKLLDMLIEKLENELSKDKSEGKLKCTLKHILKTAWKRLNIFANK
ncbi:zinc-binding alcohol dehydrogenase [Pectobacterium phage POP12]|nr:zinc-binding alcohol dehydrogenase [Pectobacterium phage POP12]